MIAPPMLTTLADASNAASVMRDFVTPVVQALCVAASLACAYFLTTGGYHYMTSSGNPENLDHAKRTIRNALIGLLTVLAAAVLTTILTHAYAGSAHAISSKLPALTPIQPTPVSNGLVDVLIKAVTGFLNNIIQTIAEPFLKALSFFTTGTPLMADNSAVFNLWLVVVGMTDVLFVLIVALLGFHVMGAASFGFDEVEFKHLLPRLALVFLLVNCSIFAIDGVIELSNAMIKAINAAGPANSVWDVLTTVVKQAGGQSVAALLIMLAFLIFAFILLIYYLGRLVTLFIGAVLSPLLLIFWLIPGFKDFSETAAKVYLTTIFVLFVHVVILQLAASLLAGAVVGSPGQAPNTLMSLMIGLAALIALLKTQGAMTQLSYASIGPKTARKLGGQFVNAISYTTKKGRKAVSTVDNYHKKRSKSSQDGGDDSQSKGYGGRQPAFAYASYAQPTSRSTGRSPYDDSYEAEAYKTVSKPRANKTGETTVAPSSSKASKNAKEKS